MRMHVIGSPSCVLGHALTGVDGRAVRSPEELLQALDEALADSDIGLLLVSSDVGEWARERLDALKVSRLEPVVVEIPGEHEGRTLPSLRAFVQRAVGIPLGPDA